MISGSLLQGIHPDTWPIRAEESFHTWPDGAASGHCWCSHGLCHRYPKMHHAYPLPNTMCNLSLVSHSCQKTGLCYKVSKSIVKLVDCLFMHVSLTPGETSDGTGSSCPWCPCGPVVPDRAGVWSSTLSGARTPSPLLLSTVGWRSWSAAAVPAPCTAAHPSQMTCPERRGAEQNGRNQFVMCRNLKSDPGCVSAPAVLLDCPVSSRWQIQTISHWACSHWRHIRLS